jgi:hypothetical protein
MVMMITTGENHETSFACITDESSCLATSRSNQMFAAQHAFHLRLRPPIIYSSRSFYTCIEPCAVESAAYTTRTPAKPGRINKDIYLREAGACPSAKANTIIEHCTCDMRPSEGSVVDLRRY